MGTKILGREHRTFFTQTNEDCNPESFIATRVIVICLVEYLE